MGVAATTTGATMSAIQESLALLSVKLGRIAERQDKMLADLKKTTAALMPNPTTTPMFAPNGVLEQPSVKPLSPPLFSALQAVGAGVPHPDAILTSTMPTRCSTSGLGVSSGSNQAAVAFPSLNNTKATLLTPVELLGDDASKVMSMVSRVGDNAEDVAAYVLFEKVLQRDDVKCKPWPPDLPVWVRHKEPICRPQPWPSFACNQLEGVQMTLARLPWRRPYLELPTETLAMLKRLHTEGTHLLVLRWSLVRSMEHWSFPDIVLGEIIVCSSISGILGHIIKQMTTSMPKRQSLVQFTKKPPPQLVRTVQAILFVHVEHLLVTWLSRTWDPRGSSYTCWVLNSKHFAGTIRISFMNLPLDLNAVEDSKCRILAVELYFQWDPGTMLNAFIDAISGIEWGILIIRTSSQNYGYEFYSNQQSKLHCAKSEFRMLPSKDLQIPWDPGDWQNNAVCASPAQPFQVLETPWDPGALSMSRRDNLGESWSCVRLILRHEYAIAWGQAMFFGGGIVTPGTLGEVGLNVMGHGLLIMGWQCRWRASKAKLHLENGIEQKREKASRCSGGLLPPVPFSGGCYPQAVCIPRWQLSTSCSYLYLTSGDAVATGLTLRSTPAPGNPATSPSSQGTSSPRSVPAFLPFHCRVSEPLISSPTGNESQLSANVGAGVQLERGNIFRYSLRGKKAVSFTSDGLLGLNIKGRLLADKDFNPRTKSGAVELAWTILDFRKGQDVRLKAGYELYRKMPYFQLRENNWTLNGYMDGKWDVRFDM